MFLLPPLRHIVIESLECVRKASVVVGRFCGKINDIGQLFTILYVPVVCAMQCQSSMS